MEFVAAISGWQWALAAAAPIGIFALYFLKLKRKPVAVPSTFLWKKSIEDLHVNSLWQRLRQSLLLFLQLLCAAFLLFALFGPTIHASQSGRRLILIIDQSASMSTRDGDKGTTRLDAAKQKATQIAEGMSAGDAAMVIAFSDSARVLCSYSENANVVQQAIQSIEPTARNTDFREALTIASGLANPQRAGEDDPEAVPASIFLFSDGQFPEISDQSLGNLSLEYVRMGSSSKNVGLLALSARRPDLEADIGADPDRIEVFARVKNFANEAIEGTAELYADGKLTDIQKLSLPAGEEESMAFAVATSAGVIELRVVVDDLLSLDNRGWAAINASRRARVLMVGPSNLILDAAMKTPAMKQWADINTVPEDWTQKDWQAEGIGDRYDLVIFDRCTPKNDPDCDAFYIGALPPALRSLEKTPLENPAILNWNAGHPVLRFLNLDDVDVLEAFTIAPPPGVDRLIESDRGPLLFAVPRGVHVDIVQTFDLLDRQDRWRTDWPLKASFPLYFMNIVRSLGVGDTALASSKPGEPIVVRPGSAVASMTVEDPAGKKTAVQRSKTGEIEYLDTDSLGVYSFRPTTGDESSVIRQAVNLMDAVESTIAPADRLRVGASEVSAGPSIIPVRRELWRHLAFIALLLLGFEWYIYNRRVYL